jgi:hypothetical protein
MPGYIPNELLSRLVGYELYEVSFVLDYLQLRFQGTPDEPAQDSPLFNVEVWPTIEVGDKTYREPDLGYADALRGLINEVVTSTVERTGTGIRIEFTNAALHIHPTLDEVFVEIGMLRGFDDGAWVVWRPGEDSFEDVV